MNNSLVFVHTFEMREGDFLFELPDSISSKAELMGLYAKGLHFPDQFGGNWDALYDCLCDLSWIKEKRIVIYHRCIPSVIPNADMESYYAVLRDSVTSWHDKLGSHELVVVFPKGMWPAGTAVRL
jgi:hypothetical protein